MRIASIYDFEAYPPRGGNHVHAYQLVRRFIAEGHEVFTWGDATIPGVVSYPRTEEGIRALEDVVDVLYVRVDANRLGDEARLVRLMQRTQKPIVWEVNSPANESLAYSYLGGRGLGDRGFRRLLDAVKRRIHAYRRLPRVLREERLRRQLAPRVAAAVCVSEAVSNYAREGLGIRDVRTVPNGADHETHTAVGPVARLPFASRGGLTVLYAGSPIYPWQGLDVLERTIHLCDQAHDPIQFVLLMNQASPRQISASNTIVLVNIPHDEVGAHLRAVDVAVVIHPEFFWSRWGSHGSPMKLFDYMACGRPVVASNVGQLAEVIRPGRNGVLFDNTAEDLRRRLLELASGRYDLAALGRAARNDVERTYNWHVIGRKTLDVLERATQGAEDR